MLGAMKELQGNIEETFASSMVETFAFSTVHVLFAESSSKSFSSLAVNLSLPQLPSVQLEHSSLIARGITRVDYITTCT